MQGFRIKAMFSAVENYTPYGGKNKTNKKTKTFVLLGPGRILNYGTLGNLAARTVYHKQGPPVRPTKMYGSAGPHTTYCTMK